MRNLIFKIIKCTFILSCTYLFADWDPELIEDVNITELQGINYLNLKSEIIGELKGSWCSDEKANLIMDFIILTKPKVCVEIGAWTGSSVLAIATALRYLNQGILYAVDAWSNDIAIQYWDDKDPNKSWWSTVDMTCIRKIFQELIFAKGLKKSCMEIALPSEEAIGFFSEIDFLHLDGDYSEKGSLQDVELYLPKVKSGGYILLSRLFTMINGKQPKLKSFLRLLKECEIVCEIERDNAILLRKY